MPRLIDVDALIELLERMQSVCRTHAELIYLSKVSNQVKRMPKVDAVPVSFIQELIDRDKQLIEEYGGKQDYEIIVDGLIERAVNYEALIEKWREKNGTEID